MQVMALWNCHTLCHGRASFLTLPILRRQTSCTLFFHLTVVDTACKALRSTLQVEMTFVSPCLLLGQGSMGKHWQTCLALKMQPSAMWQGSSAQRHLARVHCALRSWQSPAKPKPTVVGKGY